MLAGNTMTRMKAQRGYYELKSAGDVIASRINALRSALPPNGSVLDIGCNDGTISKALLESGHASSVVGIDLENIITVPRDDFTFIQGDINTLDLRSLPRTDVVLLLNVLHHVIHHSRQRAVDLLGHCLNNSSCVFIDMGSFTEQGEWGWKQRLQQHWTCDGEMWDDLFREAAVRFKLLVYPTQGHGTRVLWKLYRHPPQPRTYSMEQAYRRNVAAWPGQKKLVPVTGPDDQPIPFGNDPKELSKHVMFHRLRSDLGDVYWAKQYLTPDAAQRVHNECLVYAALHQAPFRVVHPVLVHPEYGMLFPYDPELFFGCIVHHHDRQQFFEAHELAQIDALANTVIRQPSGESVKVIDVADFQTVRTREGLKFIDFAPSPRQNADESETLMAGAPTPLLHSIRSVTRRWRRANRRFIGPSLPSHSCPSVPTHTIVSSACPPVVAGTSLALHMTASTSQSTTTPASSAPTFTPPFTKVHVEAWQALTPAQQHAHIAGVMDKRVIRWVRLVKRHPVPEPRAPLIHFHLPKTGGTTLQMILSRNYQVNRVVHVTSPFLRDNPGVLFKRGHLPAVVTGHFDLSNVLYMAITRPTVHVTMLREPVSRVISFYHYVRESPKHPLHEMAMSMDLASFVKRPRAEVSNEQALKLAGWAPSAYREWKPPQDEVVAQAITNLMQRISLFGLTHRYDEFLLMARQLLGWKDIFYQKRNVTGGGARRSEVNEQTLEVIRERNQLDLALYAKALEVFEARCAELNITTQRVEHFRQQNAAYQQLLESEL